MSYVSLADFKTYLRNEITSADDTDLQMALDVADGEINDHCERFFTAAGSASAQTFVPDVGSRVLRLPDFTTVTSVVEDGTTLTVTTDYQLEPVNRLQLTGETFPYDQIRRQGGTWYTYQDEGTVVVTATWGWPAVPTKVKAAARILAKDFAKYRDVNFGIVAMSEFGGVRAREAAIVEKLLSRYRRVESFGIA